MDEKTKSTEGFQLTAPCGIYCGECECYKAKDDERLLNYLISRGIKADYLPCPGCRSFSGLCPAMGQICETFTCSKEKGVDFCYECAEFPCDKLIPAVDRASSIPHNIKVYNLCCIQHQGLTKMIERYPEVKQKYFKGRMLLGKGPQQD